MPNNTDSNVLRSFIVNCALEEACMAQCALVLKQKSTPPIPARGAERPGEPGGARQEARSGVPSERPGEPGGARQEARSGVPPVSTQARILEFAKKGIWSLKYDGKCSSDLFTVAILEIKDTRALISTLRRLKPLFEKVYGDMIKERRSAKTFYVHSKYQLSLFGCAIRFKSAEVVKYLRNVYFEKVESIRVWHLGAETHNFVKGARKLMMRQLLPHASTENLSHLREFVKGGKNRGPNKFLECIQAELNKRPAPKRRGEKRPR